MNRNIRKTILTEILGKLDKLKPSKWVVRIQVISGVASIVMIGFLVWSLMQSNESIKQANKSIELQRLSIGKTDSSISIMSEQLKLQQETIGILNNFVLLNEKGSAFDKLKYIEHNKPILVISKIDWEIQRDSILLHINLTNRGNSGASNINQEMIIMNDSNNKSIEKCFLDYSILNKRTTDYGKVKIPKKDSYLKIKIKWTWQAFDLRDSLITYRHISYINNGDERLSIIKIADSRGESLFNN